MDGDREGALVELLDAVDVDLTPIEELVGARSVKSQDKIILPMLFEYSRTRRLTHYRRGSEIGRDSVPVDATWIEIDPRLSLKRALEIYGTPNLYAFEKVVEETSLEILVLPVRRKHVQSLRILVRRPTQSS